MMIRLFSFGKQPNRRWYPSGNKNKLTTERVTGMSCTSLARRQKSSFQLQSPTGGRNETSVLSNNFKLLRQDKSLMMNYKSGKAITNKRSRGVLPLHHHRRQQHQYAAASTVTMSPSLVIDDHRTTSSSIQLTDDEDYRVAVRIFLESLHLAATTNLRTITTIRSSNNIRAQGSSYYNNESMVPEIEDERVVEGQEEKEVNVPDGSFEEELHLQVYYGNNNLSTGRTKEEYLFMRLEHLVKNRRIRKSIELFGALVHDDTIGVIPAKLTSDLFFLISLRNPLVAYDILQYYNKHHRDVDHHGLKWLPMYRRMSSTVRLLCPQKYRKRDMHRFVVSLLDEVTAMDVDAKKALYPMLVSGLVEQRYVELGKYAKEIYFQMVEDGMDMKNGWLNNLLAVAKYNRQDDLPFHDIMKRLYDQGGNIHSQILLPVIHIMFPYTDAEQMTVALKVWLDVETRNREHSTDNDGRPAARHGPYRIDLSTLEMISAGAARAASVDLILLVWDVIDFCQYEPTEMIFENTVATFASKPQFLPEAFAAMQSMKQYGFVPSRALIRSFSIAIRDKRETVDKALQVLLEDHRQAASPSSGESSPLLSLESLNVVMSAYSERGEMENAMDVLNLMEDIDIYPNEDSYSFALEALGKDVVRFQSKEDSSHLHKNVEIAGIILTRMEKNGVEPSVDVIRNYLELLCLAGEVETATSVVEQCLSTNNDRSKINNKSIYRVAMANAEACNFERAKALSKMTSEELPLLDKKIRSLESRFLAMERARELRQSRSDDKLL